MKRSDSQMTAVAIDEFGPPDVLVARGAAVPDPGRDQVRIDVRHASITFVETQIRAGRAPAPMLPSLPVVLGNGVAGTVVAVGESADPGLLGTRVASSLNGTGGYAEAALADVAALVALPAGIDTDVAAAVLADGRTAALALDALGLAGGQTLLVTAAAGGVGTLLTGLARAAGLRVLAAAGSADKRARTLELGAERALDYGGERWGAECAGEVDGVVDGVGGAIGERAAELLAPGGCWLGLGRAGGRPARPARDDIELVSIEPPTVAERVALVQRVLREVACGTLAPVIGAVHPLRDAAAAHAQIEARAVIGKTLLRVG